MDEFLLSCFFFLFQTKLSTRPTEFCVSNKKNYWIEIITFMYLHVHVNFGFGCNALL